MTQFSPPPPQYPPNLPGQAYGAPSPQKTNGPAIASLVCGIIGCVPFITSLAAVVLGIVGIKKTKNPQVGGKGLAIAGLILGLVGIAGWSLFGGGLYTAYVISKPARAAAHQFAADLAAGNVDAATAATAGIAREDLADVSQKLQPWGTLTNVTLPGFNYRADAGGEFYELAGVATFATAGPKTYTVTLVKVNGQFKVQKFNFE
jgi:hypothetical protein